MRDGVGSRRADDVVDAMVLDETKPGMGTDGRECVSERTTDGGEDCRGGSGARGWQRSRGREVVAGRRG